MQIFTNIDGASFTYNGIKYVKNFIVLKLGNTHIAVYNAYDTKLQLLGSTHFSEVEVDGTIYGSQAALMNALATVVFAKCTGNTTFNQNNVALYLSQYQYAFTTPSNTITSAELATKINDTFAFNVSEYQTPVMLQFTRSAVQEGSDSTIFKKYIFLFTDGKGYWGHNQTPVEASQFKLIYEGVLNPEDIIDDNTSVINYLGEVADGDYISIANESEWDFFDTNYTYYFSYTTDEVLYYVVFVGEPGLYGGDNVLFTSDDFVDSTNSGALPYIPTLQEIITQGSTATTANDISINVTGGKKLKYNNSEVLTIANSSDLFNAKADLVDGKIPSSQLPSFVDDVLEYSSTSTFPVTGESGKIYIAQNTNKTYRWGGSAYVEISASLALGETSSTAYRGDRGKIAYDHTSLTNNPHNVTKSQVGLSNVDNTADLDKPVSTATQNALNLKANDGSVVHTSGTELINGAKTFNVISTFNDGLYNGSSGGLHLFKNSYYNYTNGYFVQTDIPEYSNTMFEFYIKGNGYTGGLTGLPIDTIVQGYTYSTTSSIVSTTAIAKGKRFNVDVFHYGGFVCFWFDIDDAFQTVRFDLGTQLSLRKITNVTNVAKPTSGVTNNVTIVPANTWNSSDFTGVTNTTISNWNTAYTDYVPNNYLSPKASITFNGDINTLPFGTYTTAMSTLTSNKPFSAVGGLLSVGTTGQLGFQLLGARTGNDLWFRGWSTAYDSWYKLWNSGDFTSSDIANWNSKQAALVSGTNIKTIEGQSLLGSGNIDLSKNDVGLSNVDNTSDVNKPVSTATQTALNAKANISQTITDGVTTSSPSENTIYDNFKRYIVSTEVDLNNYRESGEYIVPNTGLLNLPSGWSQGRKMLKVIGDVNGTYATQTLHDLVIGLMAFRKCSTTWSDWTTVYSTQDFTGVTNTTISNWNTAYGWGDYKTSGWGTGLQNNAAYTGDVFAITTTQVVRVANTATNLPSNQNGVLVSYYRSSVYGSLTFYADNGEMWYNTKNGAPFGAWKKVWTNSDFTTGDTANWNTAYNRGDFRDYGIGVGTLGDGKAFPYSDANNINALNGIYSVGTGVVANLPGSNSGSLIVERYSNYITQKFQAINSGDVVKMYIRHYKPASTSWTPWREIWTTENLTTGDTANWNSKQAALVSGTNIKTIEGQSILGSGNIDLTKSDVGLSNVDNTSDLNKPVSTATQTALNAKQATLVSGTNIKTIEGQSLLGSGNIDLSKSDVGLSNVDNTSDVNKPVSTAQQTALNAKQATLVSGTNIKTIGGQSLLGSGNVTEVQNSLGTSSTSLAPSVDAVNLAISLKANDSSVVHNTGTELINGAKTFTTGLTVSGASATNSNFFGVLNVSSTASFGGSIIIGSPTEASEYEAVNIQYLNGKLSGLPLTSVNTTTTPLTTSELNSTYPSVAIGSQVICANISGGGILYLKVNTSAWKKIVLSDV